MRRDTPSIPAHTPTLAARIHDANARLVDMACCRVHRELASSTVSVELGCQYETVLEQKHPVCSVGRSAFRVQRARVVQLGARFNPSPQPPPDVAVSTAGICSAGAPRTVGSHHFGRKNVARKKTLPRCRGLAGLSRAVRPRSRLSPPCLPSTAPLSKLLIAASTPWSWPSVGECCVGTRMPRTLAKRFSFACGSNAS